MPTTARAALISNLLIRLHLHFCIDFLSYTNRHHHRHHHCIGLIQQQQQQQQRRHRAQDKASMSLKQT